MSGSFDATEGDGVQRSLPRPLIYALLATFLVAELAKHFLR